jgi:hypothetical protein
MRLERAVCLMGCRYSFTAFKNCTLQISNPYPKDQVFEFIKGLLPLKRNK